MLPKPDRPALMPLFVKGLPPATAVSEGTVVVEDTEVVSATLVDEE